MSVVTVFLVPSISTYLNAHFQVGSQANQISVRALADTTFGIPTKIQESSIDNADR